MGQTAPLTCSAPRLKRQHEGSQLHRSRVDCCVRERGMGVPVAPQHVGSCCCGGMLGRIPGAAALGQALDNLQRKHVLLETECLLPGMGSLTHVCCKPLTEHELPLWCCSQYPTVHRCSPPLLRGRSG